MNQNGVHRVLITGKLAPVALEVFGREPDIEVDFKPDLPAAKILDIIDGYDCIVTRSETTISREMIDRATRLRVIARAAVGVNNIDIEYATEKGILVLNTPGKNTNSAAELTIGLLIAAVRKVIPAHQSMVDLQWNRHHFAGLELRHKTLGIIGLGNVGHRVARFARGLEMKVLAYDPYLAPKVFDQHQAEAVDLEQLCRRADIVTVHVPKTRETSGIIGAREIGWMKEGVILLNVARGGIIQEEALLEGLKAGKVRCAGIDTWANEPVRENPFKELPNVVMTPHIGASTSEAQIAIGTTVAQQAIRGLRGEVVDYPVNMPQMEILEGSPVKHYTVLAERLGRFAAQFIRFTPTDLETLWQGKLSSSDITLCKLSFLKGFLQHASEELITYVNAERKALARGLRMVESPEQSFTDYSSSIRFVLSARDRSLQVAGVVYGGGHQRIVMVNEYLLEMEPRGNILVTTNVDKPGMIGAIGTLLGQHGINIDQFELARNRPGGDAMALIRVDEEMSDKAVEALLRHEGITSVTPIKL